jgi:hypothetical protein
MCAGCCSDSDSTESKWGWCGRSFRMICKRSSERVALLADRASWSRARRTVHRPSASSANGNAPARVDFSESDNRNRNGRLQHLKILGSQATEKRFAGTTDMIGVRSSVAPRDTFNGVGVGRKTCSEVEEAIRWGHFFSRSRHAANSGRSSRRDARPRRLLP